MQKTIGGERPLLQETLGQTDRVGAKSPIFDSTSAVTPNDKSLIITNRKSTTCFPMSPR